VAIPVLGFPSKKACRLAIQAIVHPHRQTRREFFHPLLAELFATRHYALSQYGIRPVGFRWGTHPEFGTDDCFYARFEEELYPLLWWRKISYNKAIDGWRLTDATLDAELAEAYRRVALSAVCAYRGRRSHCEFPGCNETDTLDVHHVAPTFRAIAAAATALLTADERAQLIRTHDWFDETPWLLPQKCVDAIEAAHEHAQLALLCKRHHYHAGRAQAA
jgi:hypothetical protein